MSHSQFDLDPSRAPDVTCECGRIVNQFLTFDCLTCKHAFEVPCTPKSFWMWARATGDTTCPAAQQNSPLATRSHAERAALGAGLSEAELFDPASGRWSATGSLTAPRYSHTLTALRDGRALAVGGFSAGATLGTADLFDPGADGFQATSPLATVRGYHTVTLLPSGRAVGGQLPDGSVLSSAELFDPTQGTWSETRTPLLTGRCQHAAVGLVDGRVLVVGGYAAGNVLTSAEIFDESL